MALHPPTAKRERILIFGPAGSGKSSAWVSLADKILKTKSTARIYLMDTDEAYDAMVDEEIASVVELFRAEPFDFPAWVSKLREWRKIVKADDWVVVDMIDKAWTAAQDHFWKTVSGGDSLAEIYLRAKSEEKLDIGGAYGTNWGDINRLYDEFMVLFINMPCHKLALTPAQEVYVDKAGMALNKNDVEYVRFQFKPRGQNRLDHAFNTILLARIIPGGKGPEWNLTTVKERGPIGRTKRADLKGEKVTEQSGFVSSYLTKIAGWSLM